MSRKGIAQLRESAEFMNSLQIMRSAATRVLLMSESSELDRMMADRAISYIDTIRQCMEDRSVMLEYSVEEWQMMIIGLTNCMSIGRLHDTFMRMLNESTDSDRAS